MHLCLQPLSCELVHIRRRASCQITLRSTINPQSYLSPTASLRSSPWIVFEGPGLRCPHLPFVFSMVERRGRVPSAHESGYCIIFCHKLTSSPNESISTSSFPVDTVPAVVTMAHGECKICAKFDAINDK